MTAPKKAASDCIGKEIIIRREFDAPRELVFQTWTDPKHLARWWGPRGFTNPVCEWNAKPGAAIHVVMRGPNGEDYPMGGGFREVIAPERLVLTTGALDDDGNLMFELLHTVTFEDRKGKTALTITTRVINATGDAARYIGGYEAGMSQSLERLADQLAQKFEPVVVERAFSAPVALVWKALTSKEEMARWSFDVGDFKPKVGFEFGFTVEHEGTKFIHLCKVTEVIPLKRLAYTWRYEGHQGDSLVTIELFDEGNQTRLKLTHTGLETFPKTKSFAPENFLAGWTDIIGRMLKESVEKDAANTSDRDIVVSRVFDAPRELVWQAMSDPKHVANWWGPRGFTTTIEKMDFRVGGVWKQILHGPDGANYPNKSIFRDIVKPERIVYSHAGGRENGPGAHFVATWTFETVETSKTKLTIHLVFFSPGDRDLVVREFGAIEGGKQTLARLAEYLAKS